MRIPRRTLWLTAVALVLGLASTLWHISPGELVSSGREFIESLWGRLKDEPVLLYLFIVILPAFPIPQSPFVVLAGIVYAEFFGETLGAAIAASAVGLNILWTYFLTVGPLHVVVSRVLSWFGYHIPRLPAEDMLKFSFLVRVTPVFPLCVQNYTLGLLRVPLGKYLLASWSTQVPLAFAIALTAGAILEGKLGAILIAVAVLLFLALALKFIRKRLRKDKSIAAISDELAAETTGVSHGEKIE